MRNLTRVGYTDPVGKPIFDVMSLYSRTVNFSVVGQKWTLLTTFGLTREPTYRTKSSNYWISYCNCELG